MATPGVDTGTFQIISGLSAGALDADLVPSTDVSSYSWLSVYIGGGSYLGTITFQFSFDNSLWLDLPMCPMAGLSAYSSSTPGVTVLPPDITGVVVGTPVWFQFFRVRMTSYTSGSATGVLHLHTNPIPGLPLFTTVLGTGSASIGLTNNNGQQNLPIASGHNSDTVVSGLPGMLASILVTTTNTNQMTFYDNASAGSGTPVGIVPASATVGTIIPCQAPVVNGITAKGNANNPGVTVFFT